MNELVEKLREIEKQMAEEKGPFDLFALFLREGSPEYWDLVVAGDWIKSKKEESLKYISNSIQKSLSKNDLLKLSRIVIIDEDNPALASFHRAVQIEHGATEVKDGNFFGMDIRHAYLITSKRHNNIQLKNQMNQE